MRILMIASEAQPFAKTGGLADVLGALPRALTRVGHDVDVVIPRYRGIPASSPAARVSVPFANGTTDVSLFSATEDKVRTLFVDHPAFYDRDALYGTGGQDYPDNPERFALLARAALGWADSAPAPYDVLHAHDWQAGLVPFLLRSESAAYPRLEHVGTVLTVHNLAYQGIAEASWLQRLGLSRDERHVDALEYWGRISFLKGGIVTSRLITTVSPTYAREIQTTELGFGFDGILRQRQTDLVGILNGIDYDEWDPSRDRYLPMPFEASRLEGKTVSKREVLAEFGLPVTDDTLARPLVAMITRLVDQKGLDLVAELADELPQLDATFVLLGTGERRYEDLWLSLASRHPDRIGARIEFNEALAHRIEGGADLFLMPSRFEPCGLNQMYSLRYGTLPLVHATGGLADTVRSLDTRTGEGNGFSFDEYSARALLGTLTWALDIYKDRALWRRMQAAGMLQDMSWDSAAREYEKTYVRAITPGRDDRTDEGLTGPLRDKAGQGGGVERTPRGANETWHLTK